MRMKHGKWLSIVVVVVGAATLALGCSQYGGIDTTFSAPLLSGSTDAKDHVDLRGAINYGDAVKDAFSADKPITGYVLSANQGARITATLVSEGQEDPVLLLYGPQDAKGIWGKAIVLDDNGKDGRNSLISDFALPAGGRFLVAVAKHDGAKGGKFDLSLGCRGSCDKPVCPGVMCDLYCPNGFMTDPNGCPLCRCIDGECQTDKDCITLYPWAQGVPSCVDGKCVFSAQACDDSTPCPPGSHCEMVACPMTPCVQDPTNPNGCPPCQGQCVPNQPMCKSDADCKPGEVCDVTTGRCVAKAIPCSADSDCPAGDSCVMACAGCDPSTTNCPPNPQCQGFCQPSQPPSCDQNTACPAGFQCVMECWACASTDLSCICPPDDPACKPEHCQGYCVPVQPPECQADTDCRSSDGQVGICVNGRCIFQQIPCDDTALKCPDGMQCLVTCNGGPYCDPNDPTCVKPCDPTTDPTCVPDCKGVCVPVQPPECQADTDCQSPDGQLGRCIQGKCVYAPITCTADSQCPPGMRCEMIACAQGCDPNTNPDPSVGPCCTGQCVPAQPECTSDKDCISSDGTMGRCIDGKCVYSSCACPTIWDPVCGAVCPICGGDIPCGAPCVQETFANLCFAQCAGAQILYAGECGSNPGTCTDNSQCPPGDYCELCPQGTSAPCSDVGKCVPVPPTACKTDADCPQGFTCVLGPCPAMPCDPNGNCPPCMGQCVPPQSNCIVTGCNGEVCAPMPVNTTCIWLPEYACLKLTTCESLIDPSTGQATCGFVQTQEYLQCLLNIQNPPVCQADTDCPPGQVCQKICDSAGNCKSACYQQDCICPQVVDPVCGVDGKTYTNECYLTCADVGLAHPGACEGQPNP